MRCQKNICQTLGKMIKARYQWFNAHPFTEIFCLAMVINLVVEMFSRRSVIEGLMYLLAHPLMFSLDMVIIMATLSLALMFKRRDFVLIVVSVIWLGLGFGNWMVLGFRVTPLGAIDFSFIKSVLTIIDGYMTPMQLILVGIGALLVIALLVVACLKSPQSKVSYGKAVSTVAGIAVVVFVSTSITANAEAVTRSFSNLANAYNDFGFAYCFSTSVVDRGIDQPGGYSKWAVENILNNIQEKEDTQAVTAEGEATVDQQQSEAVVAATEGEEVRPNIILVQLESFFDVNFLHNLSYSENPIPNFTRLKQENSSGFLTVPSIGAGTANTEFEVISGMSLDYFGIGEYPYKTIVKERTCESVCYDLREQGYVSHAIHNHDGTFYDRHLVYPNLGFDSFTSLEYMSDVELTPRNNWAKDGVLTEEVLKALNSTEGQDFIFTISVQGHGKYSSNKTEYATVSVTEGIEDPILKASFEYYLTQIKETDAFVGALIAALSESDEPTVVVFYGDHLPSFDLTDEDLSNNDVFQTEYAFWSNFEMENIKKDLSAYQLSAYVMERLGMDNGILTKLHQDCADNDDYEVALEMLQYDMLYGDMYAYGGINPYAPADMRMGIEDVTISRVVTTTNTVFVVGENFTEWSTICINDEPKETVFIDDTRLMVADTQITEPCTITVKQIGEDGDPLSSTDEYLYQPEILDQANIEEI